MYTEENKLKEEEATHSKEKEKLEEEIERLKSRPPEQVIVPSPIVVEEQTTTRAEPSTPEVVTKETIIGNYLIVIKVRTLAVGLNKLLTYTRQHYTYVYVFVHSLYPVL